MSVKIDKNLFSNKEIISEYNQYKRKYDEYDFKKGDIKNDIKDVENKIKNQKNLKSKINKIAIGIIISGSLIGVVGAITASVIVTGGAIKAFVLSGVLIAVLIASSVFLLVAVVSLIVSICLFAFSKKLPKKISEYEKEILTHQNSLQNLEEQNPLKNKKPFLPMQGSPEYDEVRENRLGEGWPEEVKKWEEVYFSLKELYEDIFEIKKYESEEEKKKDVKIFNRFRKYYYAERYFSRGTQEAIFKIYRKLLGNKGKEFFNDISEIINGTKTYEEKIELIECHPMITITNCLKELHIDHGSSWVVFNDCYLEIFNNHVNALKKKSEFFNSFVMKMFEKSTDSIEKIAKKVVEHIENEAELDSLLKKVDLIEDKKTTGYRHEAGKNSYYTTYYTKGWYLKSLDISKNKIVQALKEAWKEKTNQNL